ncbi:M20 aminoacylase family protein [Rhizobium rhizogenes]|uniref:M20 aminoacylase family protein n=1 Tax=Rhizobium rhizogenes TaxID=359 RepID=UPI0004D35489|nr:M20 aminoacylase family protein [Rhizobium rhizogenes]KEA03834.1 amidohydrolase [Rhizobium rhizogenes]MQB32101.1 amidohydrolase [Rhizobium rhizogenes]NTI82158.1 amidohydrolase [Rhizobium rhizogenes]NTJ24340.1 amidohydrolase [Rhizobium rhizogenes]QUE79381.1 amidohydrolase [Rhizobium rhizogenes]
MPILNRAAELQDEVTEWRRHIHTNPELLYAVEKTAAFVAEKLKAFGVDEVVTGIGRTGVVGLIRGKGPGRTVGLRADMDALPLTEISGKPWASTTPGKMHACGHDGHTAMLLGAAKYLAETRNFSGNVAVIFQPAEEGGAGGDAMVKDGMMERFEIAEVYGMHNLPGLPVGQFAIRKGPIMAATDEFTVTIKGRGGHAALPHKTIDPIAIGAQIITNLQLIASRSADPLKSVVVTVTKLNAGNAYNVIPDNAGFAGTVRTLDPAIRDLAERRFKQIVAGIAASHDAEVDIEFQRNYPVTFNHADETDYALAAARDIAGVTNVVPDVDPMMGGEDFSYMLNARPGAFIFIGNGDTAGLHNAAYDFTDEAIAHGVSYWVRLAEQRLGA